MRLDKFLTDCGCGTRSEVKKIIRAKRITINGALAEKPEQKIDEKNDCICIDEKALDYELFSYFLLYKPMGCVTANTDHLHTTVMNYITEPAKGLFPVGRLDIDTEGVLLITNDGQLAHRLLSPARHVKKTYYALLDQPVPMEAVKLFAEGVDIGDEKPTLPAKLTIFTQEEGMTNYPAELTIYEGRYHQVKRMFEAIGCSVLYLKRIQIGTLTLEGLKPGEYRRLTNEEIKLLLRSTDLARETL